MSSTLYRHGVVHTSADPFAEAVLVEDGVVAWLGADDTADGFAARADHVVDLDGALVTPGFVDAHVHVLETGLALESVDLSPAGGVHCLADALAAVARAAASRSDGAGPVLGFGWDELAWPEGRPPTRDEVDAAAGGAPVYLARVDVHSAVVSSSLAAASGADRADGWSADGRVERDAHHVAREAARAVQPERRTALYERALAHAAARGVVSVHEHSAPSIDTRAGLVELLELTADAAAGFPHLAAYRGELCVTVDDARQLMATIPGLTGIGGDLNVDGSIGSRTAALRSAYTDAPGTRGTLYLAAEQIANHITAVSRARLQSGFHVIGDAAMDEVLLGLRAAADVEGAPALARTGLRLEHAEMVDAPTLAALVLLGVRLSVQPAFDAAWGGTEGMYATRLGAGRAAALNPFADLAGAGVPLAFGSDSPVTSLDPWAAVRAAAFHHEPEQRISARAAFRAASRGGWRLAGHDQVGELRVGSPAHLAVWETESLVVQAPDGRLSAWSPDAQAGIPLLPDLSPEAVPPRCLRTVRDGVVIFDALG
ncbi:amidohydrolase [Cellulomonas edaphi]|uniref:Amidohydrolase family protein n=1 Tax=Cellulomonas edaphi TaxID=3053468 RepID=A0ABT7S6D5_9CELL|nr:amidohydrolase family protein [Cellulomons edaphi]MDM7831175.1 amidohydrolase family protein [Cellulomons edaphi]